MSTFLKTALAASLVFMLAACQTAPKKDLALEQVKSQLAELKANEDLAGYAPVALGEAERALRQAETATGDNAYRTHLIYMADRRIQIARAIAEGCVRAVAPVVHPAVVDGDVPALETVTVDVVFQ